MRRFLGYLEDKFYIPLCEEKAKVLSLNASPSDLFENMTNAEIAGALLVQHVTSLGRGIKAVVASERILFDLIAWGQRQGPEDVSLASEAKRLFDVDKFKSGMSCLREIGLEFLTQEDVLAQDYLLADGTWDYDFRLRHVKRVAAFKVEVETPSGGLLCLSSPQSLIVKSFLAEKDESIHIQGYAGTGKTHLISSLIEFMSPSATLVLAKTQVQLYELTGRLKKGHVVARTFKMLASELLAPIRPHLSMAADDYLQVSDAQVARVLSLGPVGAINPIRVAAICRRAIRRYCESGDITLNKRNLPYIKEQLSNIDSDVMVQYATRIWEATISPAVYEIRFPVRGYHLLKCLSLSNEVIPDTYTHVIVDESHDLSRPILQILDRSPQAVITFGDEYQCIAGPVFQRAKKIRQRDITLSVRAGKDMEGVLNPLIDAHPTKIKLPYEGGGDDPTNVVFYDLSKVPDAASTILVDSEWGMFEWFQRLSHAGVRFSILHGSRNEFERFMVDCINLYHSGTPPKHRKLFFYPTWDALAQGQADNKVFDKIQAMMERGYNIERLKISLLSLDSVSSGGYQLGMVENARNAEYDSVMLAPDLFGDIKQGDVLGFDRKICSLYTGGSRAKFELLVPGYIGDWVSSQKHSVMK
ncbi:MULTISPECIES: AAA family ATPase [unclassified Pseudomonas]|uniref:AAA family ATPase n=1 Tax=unclassified Pseudomonas TaxID=196821 RepID=UPI000C86B455|nr:MULTISPECIES: AAA family ATPase [unclassified Pseudomonas]PMU20717.1 helicase [Pseudomonas sp. GP01-A9]PMU27885.1 helicase [Pseudomonas sp. GP01-A13]PMU36287.1 helicase [Pseudomonas sp. GP01-A8]PMU50991.1 helicase [Pseudomonas sp. GP01-A6]PMU51557.1 helicase [Pseudomonas sp. GP01-A14]